MKVGKTYTKWIMGILLVSLLAYGCASGLGLIKITGNGEGVDGATIGVYHDPTVNTGNPNPIASLPGFPAPPATGGRTVSTGNGGDDGLVDGDEFISQYGDDNREGDYSTDGHIIAPGGDDDLAWAKYYLGTFSEERPIEVNIQVTGVIAPGGDDDLPLSYWVGLSDHTEAEWHLIGPFDSNQELTINGDDISDRIVNENNECNILILTDASEVEPTDSNPEGITSVEILSVEVVSSSEYTFTAPIIPFGLGLEYNSDTQSVELSWVHLDDTSDSRNNADNYRIRRWLVGSDSSRVIGTVDAPGTSFVDPDDSVAGTPALESGETYQYFIRAENDANTLYVLIGEVSIN